MKILFAVSEFSPIIKVGGLGDVTGSLVKNIKNAGHDVRVVMPYYSILKENRIDNLKKIASTQINIGQNKETIDIYQALFFNNITVYLIDNENYLSSGGIYLDSKDFSSISRFLFFCISVTKVFKLIKWEPDIIHTHDWQTGFIAPILKLKKSRIKTLFTIHNLLIQGQWNSNHVLDFLKIKHSKLFKLSHKYKINGLYNNNINIMQQAILCSDLITTVSPSYAKEIKTNNDYAKGLLKTIRKRKKHIYGILNGIDIDFFNPGKDNFIKKNYSIYTLDDKVVNKLDLQKKANLTKDPNILLLGIISRFDIQKGIDLICNSIDKIVDLNIQVVFLGKGVKKYEKMVVGAAKKYPKNIAAYIKFDSQLAQQIYAGSDIFLMPSRFEPCGLSQLIAMRYGTLPLVRFTGGLKDTVQNAKNKKILFGLKELTRGTGFVFKKFKQKDFINIIEQAAVFYSNKKKWRQLQINAMKKDFSWHKSAQKYLKLYKKLIK